MLDNPPLLTVHRGHKRPAAALLDRFRGAQTSHLVDAMDGRGAMDWKIKPLDPARAIRRPRADRLRLPGRCRRRHGRPRRGPAGRRDRGGERRLYQHRRHRRPGRRDDEEQGRRRLHGLARDKAGIVATGLPLAAGVVPTSPATNGPGVVGAPIVWHHSGEVGRRRGRRCRWGGGGADRAGRGGAGRRSMRSACRRRAKAVAAVEAGRDRHEKVRG